jgi:hypothetical protein
MSHPSSDAEEPAYLSNDPGLACLASQLRRTNAQIMCLERLKESVADEEEQCRTSIDFSSSKDKNKGWNAGAATTTPSSEEDAKKSWVKHYDTKVQAEYWYNSVTGEASWLDPRYGSMAN